jgi:hypothetical protein
LESRVAPSNAIDRLDRLIDVAPSTLTPRPGEPGRPNHAWVDVQSGAAAVSYNGQAARTAGAVISGTSR